MIQLFTNYSMWNGNIQARVVREVVQSASWLLRQQGMKISPSHVNLHLSEDTYTLFHVLDPVKSFPKTCFYFLGVVGGELEHRDMSLDIAMSLLIYSPLHVLT